MSFWNQPPPLLGERDSGISTCSRRMATGVDCDKAATVHAIWTEDLENGLCCDEHWADAQAHWSYFDWHPFGGFCAMPGTDLVFSWERPPGECVLPLDDVGGFLEDMARATEPAMAPESEGGSG